MQRLVTIRQSLLRSLILVILILAAGILITTVWGARRSVTTLSDALIDSTIEQTELKLRDFFEPVHRGLHVARQWGERGLLDLDRDRAELNRLFVPVLEQFPQISSVLVADGAGREFMLLRTSDGWSNRETRKTEWGNRTRWHTWRTHADEPADEWRELDYDPRDRPWFIGAIEQAAAADQSDAPDVIGKHETHVHWTQPYRFFTTNAPGVTASLTFDDGSGLPKVVAFDVLISSIADYTTSMDVSPHGGLVVLTDDGRMIGLPRVERYQDPALRAADLLKRPNELDWDFAVQASRAFEQRESRTLERAVFESDGQRWWGETRPFALTTDRLFYIAVVIPEADMLGSIPTMRLWIIGITAVVLLAAIWRAMVLARRFSEPIEALVEQSNRISHGDFDVDGSIESPVAEVNQLAEAHDRMRDGLKSLLKLERDLLLAREIQQNTFPGQLPTIDGFDIAAWNEPADQTGGDSYDVIGVNLSDNSAGASVRRISALHADEVFLLLADATGHGIGPALSATQIRAMLRMAVRINADLAAIAHHLNDQLTADLPESRFITAWLGVLDGSAGTITSFSAGQGPILHYVAADRAHRRIEVDAPPFGITSGMVYDVAPPITLAVGDIVIVASDGIAEAVNSGGRQFGTARIEQVIADNAHRTAAEILTAIRWALREFTGDAARRDDQTAIIVKRV